MTTKAQGIERLLRLADLLETLPSNAFYIGDWKVTVEEIDKWKNWKKGKPRCGFAACACGWAIEDPWFQEQGFAWDGEDFPTPAYRGRIGFHAAVEFFHLPDFWRASYLFDCGEAYVYEGGNPKKAIDITADEVAAKLREEAKMMQNRTGPYAKA